MDYEKLCVLLTGVPDSIPISRSEAVFSRLQDCVEDSVTEGRPFLSLCALVDRQQTGSITKEVSRKACTSSHTNTRTHLDDRCDLICQFIFSHSCESSSGYLPSLSA